MAEVLGASALWAVFNRSEPHLFNDLFAYIWTYFVDQERGGWHQLLNKTNHRYSNIKAPSQNRLSSRNELPYRINLHF